MPAPRDDVRRDLERVAGELAPSAWDLRGHLVSGKQLRVRLVLAAASIGPAGVSPTAVRHAAAIELLHAAGLCHDDLADGSHERRGVATAWASIGPRPAILAGAWLATRAVVMLADDGGSATRAVARAVRDLVRGQTDELGDLFADDLSPDGYLRRAYAKTGALYELAAWLGATAGGASATDRDAVTRFAARIGVAFQIADDLRDLVGGAGFGREPGTDVRTGVLTLPVLLTLRGRVPGAEALRAALRLDGARRVTEVVALVRENGAWDASLARIDALAAEARGALATLPPSPARDELAAVGDDIVGRVEWVAPAPQDVETQVSGVTRPLLAVDLLAQRRRIEVGHDTAGRVGVALGRVSDRSCEAAIALATAAASLVAVADEAADARATAMPRQVALADLLLSDVISSASAMAPAATRAAARVTCDLFRQATERALASADARIADSVVLAPFASALAAAVRSTEA